MRDHYNDGSEIYLLITIFCAAGRTCSCAYRTKSDKTELMETDTKKVRSGRVSTERCWKLLTTVACQEVRANFLHPFFWSLFVLIGKP
jgi:CHAT domain-containing protein